MNQVDDHQELLNWKKYLQLDMTCFLLDTPRYQDGPLSHQKLTKSDQASSTIKNRNRGDKGIYYLQCDDEVSKIQTVTSSAKRMIK